MYDLRIVEEQQNILLDQLEAEGRKIAKYRKNLSDLMHSGRQINRFQLLSICDKLNRHISSFDQISQQLIDLENVFHSAS